MDIGDINSSLCLRHESSWQTNPMDQLAAPSGFLIKK